MKLPFSGLSKRTVADRYERIAASFSPDGRNTDYPDQVTWAALRLAHQQWLAYYADKIDMASGNDPRRLLGNEALRLIIDGYILGRIENGSEERLMRFALVGTDKRYEAGEFALASAGAISDGVLRGKFSQKPHAAVSLYLREFAMDAAGRVFDQVKTADENVRIVGEAFGRAVNVGRELAFTEEFYLNPKKRSMLLKIRERIRKEELHRLRQIQDELAGDGLNLPSDFAEQIMARAHSHIQQLEL